jgi:hypothetical protein
MTSMLAALAVARELPLFLVPACPPVPALTYAPAAVGWQVVVLSGLDVLMGIACIGILGSILRWTADDIAPLRWLWMALIMLGFLASSAGLYIAFANKVHSQAVDNWLAQAAHISRDCITTASMSPSLMASTTRLSIELGGAAITFIALGVLGAAIERRRARPEKS